MQFDFEPDKDAINRDKHGVSLAFSSRIWDDVGALPISSFRPIDDEYRWKLIGLVDGRLWTAVHVYRGEIVRLISARKSNDGEIRGYDRHSGRS